MSTTARPSAERAARVRAILLLAAGVTLFAAMDGVAKLLTGAYPVVQVVWARYAFAVPVVLLAAGPARWPDLLRCARPGLQAGRALLPVLANMTAVLGLGLMPLADATAISFVSPLLVIALSAPLLEERVTVHGWVGVAVGFVGILVIVRPGLGTIAWAAIFPLATAFVFALYQVLTRLVSRGDPPMVTLAWTIGAGLVVVTPLLPAAWRTVSGPDWALLALSGLLFGAGPFLLIRAYATAAASLLAPFTYVQIMAAVLFGLALFGDVPDRWTLLGMGLVTGAGIHVLRRQAG